MHLPRWRSTHEEPDISNKLLFRGFACLLLLEQTAICGEARQFHPPICLEVSKHARLQKTLQLQQAVGGIDDQNQCHRFFGNVCTNLLFTKESHVFHMWEAQQNSGSLVLRISELTCQQLLRDTWGLV